MIIYSNTQDEPYDRIIIDQFVGEDIWVKMYLPEEDETTYVRLIDKLGDGEYIYNAYLWGDYTYDIDEVLYGELTGYIGTEDLVTPLETMTTEEFIAWVEADMSKYPDFMRGTNLPDED